MLLKITGSILQGFGLLYFLLFSVGASALSLYTLFTGQSGAVTTELGGLLTVLSFFGAVPLGLLVVGFILVKNATGNSYFPNKAFETVGKLAFVPISIALGSSFFIITVPFLIYTFYRYKMGVETNTVRFIKWAVKDWYITLFIYAVIVACTAFFLFIQEPPTQSNNVITERAYDVSETVVDSEPTDMKKEFANEYSIKISSIDDSKLYTLESSIPVTWNLSGESKYPNVDVWVGFMLVDAETGEEFFITDALWDESRSVNVSLKEAVSGSSVIDTGKYQLKAYIYGSDQREYPSVLSNQFNVVVN